MCKLKYFRAKSDPDSTERHIFTMGWTVMTLCIGFSYRTNVLPSNMELDSSHIFGKICQRPGTKVGTDMKWIGVIPLFFPPDIIRLICSVFRLVFHNKFYALHTRFQTLHHHLNVSRQCS